MTGKRDGTDASVGASDDDVSALLPSLDAEAGPARPLSEQELALFAARIEQQFTRPAPSRLRRMPRRLVIVAASFAASAAAAVYVGVFQGDGDSVASSPAPSVPVSPSDVSRSAAPLVVPVDAAPSADAANAAGPSEPQRDERPAKRKPSSSTPDTSQSAARSNSVRSRSPALDRLAAANALRGERRYREAIGAYLQVIELDPNGMPAAVARVAAAEMRLEQFGDVAGAEQLYRQAKTRGGELTAEAQFGLAQVYRARSETSRERQALEQFVARHPESPLVAAARRRLQALGSP